MARVSASDLLAAWEHGQTELPVRRALLLLAAAHPATPQESVAAMSIGQRDGELLALREELFGAQLTGLTACPECADPVELDFAVSDIRVAPGSAVEEPIDLSLNGYTLRFRLPNCLDVAALSSDGGPEEGVRQLRDRCLLDAEYEGAAVPAAELPEVIVEAMSDRMAEADPQADVRLALCCPACGTAWQARFDIASFLWAEVDAWSRRTLREVHLLASAYGWSEGEILAMSPLRRRLYLEMVSG
jgi:hypothetical protein